VKPYDNDDLTKENRDFMRFLADFHDSEVDLEVGEHGKFGDITI